jgi:hypothetical protein
VQSSLAKGDVGKVADELSFPVAGMGEDGFVAEARPQQSLLLAGNELELACEMYTPKMKPAEDKIRHQDPRRPFEKKPPKEAILAMQDRTEAEKKKMECQHCEKNNNKITTCFSFGKIRGSMEESKRAEIVFIVSWTGAPNGFVQVEERVRRKWM